MAQTLYLHPDNPQARLVNQAVAIIRQGGVIAYPTDSGYALGCLLGDKSAMDKIIRIRRLDKNHHFTLVCRDLSELSLYARVENQAFRMLKNNTPGAYTFILRGTKEVPRRLLNPKRKTIGIRVPEHNITQALLEALGEPLMSVSLILPGNDVAESDPDDFINALGGLCDLVIHGGVLPEQPTTVIELTDEQPQLIREGAGDPSPFL